MWHIKFLVNILHLIALSLESLPQDHIEIYTCVYANFIFDLVLYMDQ